MSAKKRSRRARAVPAPQAAAMAHARWAVERVRGVIGRLRALRGAGLGGAAARAKTRAAGEKMADVAAPSAAAGGPGSAKPGPRSRGELRGRATQAARLRLARWAAASRVGARRMARALGPVLTRGLRGLALGSRGLARALVRQRAPLIGLLHRLLWWGSLALFVIGGRIVADPHSGGTLAEALPLFVGGLGLCAAAAFFAASARIRWASLALGASHAGLALLLWAVSA